MSYPMDSNPLMAPHCCQRIFFKHDTGPGVVDILYKIKKMLIDMTFGNSINYTKYAVSKEARVPIEFVSRQFIE